MQGNQTIDSEMVRYYSARAGEYDDWYLRRGRYSHGTAEDEAWRSDLDAAADWLGRQLFHGRIVELAAGTGWWSPPLARMGDLTLLDAAPEPLEIACARLEAAGLAAEFKVRDAWAEPIGAADGLFTGFWISHIDRSRLDEFFALAFRWLAPGGRFAFVDSRPDSASSAQDHRPPEEDIQVRRLQNGSIFRVRKVFYEPAELADAMARAGLVDVAVEVTERFFVLGSARRL